MHVTIKTTMVSHVVMFPTLQMMLGIEAFYFQERPHTVFFVMGYSQLLYID